jgi:hypothetical protein
MREMRDRAAVLYVTVGPSPLGIPVNVGAGAPAYVPTTPKALATRPAGKPISQLSSIDRYREAFAPVPSRPNPKTPVGRFLRRTEAYLLGWI